MLVKDKNKTNKQKNQNKTTTKISDTKKTGLYFEAHQMEIQFYDTEIIDR